MFTHKYHLKNTYRPVRKGLYVLAFLLVLASKNPAHIFAEEENMVTTETQEAVIVEIEGSDRPIAGKDLCAKIKGELKNVTYRWEILDYAGNPVTVVSQSAVSGSALYTLSDADYEKWVKITVLGTDSADHAISVSNQIYVSKLPVVYIDTEDGLPVYTKTAYKAATMLIQGNSKYPLQFPVKSNQLQIKGRGNSSWVCYNQRPYKLKLEKKTDLFGMGSNKHWVLLSDYYDICALRFKTATNLAKELGLEHMDVEWVTVVMNGSYAGVYQLAEQIRTGENRIQIKDWEEIAEEAADAIYKGNKSKLEDCDQALLEAYMKSKLSWITTNEVTYKEITYQVSDWYQDYEEKCKDIAGGYLFEMSNEYDEVSKFMTPSGIKVMLQNPEYLYTNSEMMSYVNTYWNDYDDAANAWDGYTESGVSLYELADMDSMVAYWMTQEILGNNDAIYKSRYAYMDQQGKLTFGPVWDFDWGCATIPVGEVAKGWKLSSGTLWKDWLDDPYFLSKAVEQYWAHHDYLSQLIAEDGFLQTSSAYIKEAGMTSYWKWAYLRDYNTDYEIFKRYMTNRIAWLDQQFASVDALSKSVLEVSNHAYKKMSNLQLTLKENSEKTEDAFLFDVKVLDENTFDGKVEREAGNSQEIKKYTKNAEYDKLIVTINGEHKTTYTMTEAAEVSVNRNWLQKDGTRNIVAFWLYGEKDTFLYSNYAVITYQQNRFVVSDLEGNIEKHEFVPSTSEREGNQAYWLDKNTGKKYLDERLSQSVSDAELVIEKLNNLAPATPSVEPATKEPDITPEVMPSQTPEQTLSPEQTSSPEQTPFLLGIADQNSVNTTSNNASRASNNASTASNKSKSNTSKKAKLNVTHLILDKKHTYRLKIINGNGKKVTWSSQKSNIVSVNKKGKVRVRKADRTYKVKIFAKIKGGKKLVCHVYVLKNK